jgi:DNA-binding helix-hairpin-helix protein with protein kinase domain
VGPVVAEQPRARVDQRQQFLRGRAAHQGVHVVVEDDRQGCVVGVGMTQRAPVGGQFADRRREAVRALAASWNAERDGGRDGGERVSGFEHLPPVDPWMTS